MRSELITNYTEITFTEKLKDNLRKCKSFCFSVSFIKKAGLVLLFKDIEAAVERGCSGKIITSTYQNFTDIESLKSFFALMSKSPNFKCHLDYDCFMDNQYSTLGYHTKGYLFEFEDSCEIIIGSSNITRYALLKNIEWDLVLHDTKETSTYTSTLLEFNKLWEQTHELNSDIIYLYANRLDFAIERWDMDYSLETRNIKPNFMQRKALKELNRYRSMGIGRALVVAAAGSGKTYLAAFDALNFNPKRLLYIVHEGSILKKSLETFQDVFGGNISYGIFSGESKEMDADFVFATNLTMNRSLELFAKSDFDYIIIDECHHATASTYKNIINYFEPEFLLGLTATPERMDREDVLDLFDKNVPYELRLRDAIINGLIVPFKYFGIRDQLVDYGLPSNQERKMVAQLANEEHCNFIRDSIEIHRPQGKLKALAFCRNITHARMMCEVMGEYFKTAYLTGSHQVGERIRAYNDLQNDNSPLEILFTVDILNEGVDIPGVNMVLFLRPTESSTVFIQQLGRGLRQYENKEYVTVLDFIGNSYKRSVQIAFAMSSLAQNFVVEKRLMKKLVDDDFEALGLKNYGVEINIDQLSKEEINHWIEQENFNSLTYLKQDYYNFKKYILAESWPRHMDYLNNDCAPDILRFINTKIAGKKNGSYYQFLRGIEEENLPIFSQQQIGFADYLSNMLPLVRSYEYLLYQYLLDSINTKADLSNHIEQEITDFSAKELNHALEYMLRDGFISQQDDTIQLMVTVDEQFKMYIQDLIEYGLKRYQIDYADSTDFKLWANYRVDQVQRKLCKNPRQNFKGTYIYESIVYIFASIKKDASIQEQLNYKDKFLESALFQWECESGLSTKEQQKLIESKSAHLFIRKVASEYGLVLPYTYVGTGKLTNARPTENPRGSLLFDIPMDATLPDYLQYDFGLNQ